MSDSSERYELLRANYAQSLISKYSALESTWHEFAASPTRDALRELHVLVHRLVGSAPGYGYERIGDCARATDVQIVEWDKQPETSRESVGDLAKNLARRMRALLDALAHSAAEAPLPPAS
ncbi:MAG: hypothetical protein ACREPX_08570 [Rhodanobacteraceae bacterium]